MTIEQIQVYIENKILVSGKNKKQVRNKTKD